MTNPISMTALCGVLACGTALPAAAATMRAEFTGTIQNSQNGLGLFGGGSLNSLGFVLTYVYDTSVGVLSGPPNDQVYGGTGYGRPSPSLGATLTINGLSRAITGNYGSVFYVTDFPSYSSDAYYASASDDDFNFIRVTFGDFSELLPDELETPFTVTDFSGFRDQVGGHFSFYAGASRTEGQLVLSTAKVTTVAPVSSVPLPASLPLLFVGSCLLPVVGRRRRSSKPA